MILTNKLLMIDRRKRKEHGMILQITMKKGQETKIDEQLDIY